MINKISIGYKLVMELEDKYYSSNLSNYSYNITKIPGVIEYKIGEWVKPKIENSKLFAFNSKNTAIKFLTNEIDPLELLLFKCEIKNKTFSNLRYYSANSRIGIEDFWKRIYPEKLTEIISNKLSNVRLLSDRDIPICLCDEIKLIERIF